MAPDAHRIKLQEPAVDFIDNRLSTVDASLVNSAVVYHPPWGRYVYQQNPTSGPVQAHAMAHQSPSIGVSPDPSQRTNQSNDYLVKGLAQLAPSEPNLSPEWDIRTKQTWGEIMETVLKAQWVYRNPPGKSGKVRNVFRKAADKSVFVEPLLPAIPSESYTAPISAALGIFINAAKASGEVNKELETTLSGLDDRIDDIEHCLECYSSSPRVEAAALGLTIAIVRAIEAAIAFYTGSSIRHFGTSIAKGKQYQAALLDKIAALMTVSEHLRRETNKDHQKTTKSIDEKQEQLLMNQHQLHRELAGVHNGLLGLMRDRYFRISDLVTHEEIQRLSARKKASETWIPQDRLLRAVDHRVNIDEDDVVFFLTASAQMSEVAKEKVAWLIRSPQVEEWLTTPFSSELLVHGNADTSAIDDDTCVTSVASAFLSRAVKGPSRRIVVSFFCSQHTARSDPDTGAIGMMRALIAQLLVSRPFRVDFLTPSHIRDIENGDIDQLCSLFGRLVSQLHGHILLCIIDGVDVYETRDRSTDFYVALRSILDLMADEELQVVIKILVTSPTTTREVRKAFQPAETVSIPSEVDGPEVEMTESAVEENMAAYSQRLHDHSVMQTPEDGMGIDVFWGYE